MAEEKILNTLCVSCPVGCSIQVTYEGDRVLKVEGNTCPRALVFAQKEISNPERVFATTVRVTGGKLPVCPVRSRGPVPKSSVFDISRAVATLSIEAPVEIGQVILPNVCGTGVEIIASRSLEAL
jgi:CxxC motif-containing protein